ncbi:hypothetical protein A1Q1_07340 [Trichosporon asahii var. asahii CBS 2479]|uniref:Uncharacterized protein n=1 Tax=Trichosporon asahii var. asahii (strain ATCC 90039 / CBS 2479 / JCM 2466 / KCTC 7840 / NBRC 103889/ NCYC 2677 / UAMH 7654) TaxID=1186058 RepID=J5R980_TRIAS|nr:hypothetical protein A1Q1_07340 [Trichosporon asahii var. asahii CBS 2479]EJT51368.1 hypothetical protein A1Q1_07340 [Trichosporon asahii var. asahii CBS 2479]
MSRRSPVYSICFPRVDWTSPGAICHPPFTARDFGKEVCWAARAASRAWADGTALRLNQDDQAVAFRLAVLDKVLEWNLQDLIARIRTTPRPSRTFEEWSESTDQYIRKAYSLAVPAAAEKGITVLPLEAILPFLRHAMRECLTYHDADYGGELAGEPQLNESTLVPFTSKMTGFTVYRCVDLHDPHFARSKLVVKHYPGQPPIGPLPLPPKLEEAEVIICEPATSASATSAPHASLTPKAARTRDSSPTPTPTPKAAARVLHGSPTPKAAPKPSHRLPTLLPKSLPTPEYPSSFPRTDWKLLGAIGLPPFTAAELGREVRWAARAASRAWADGTIVDLDPVYQGLAFRLSVLDKVFEWNLMDLLARANAFPTPPRTFAEWSDAIEKHIISAYSLAVPAAAIAGLPAPSLESIYPFLRAATRQCFSCYDADDWEGRKGERRLTEAELQPFTSKMTGFTVHGIVPLYDSPYVRSRVVVKHHPGHPPIGPLPLPPTAEGEEVVFYQFPAPEGLPMQTPEAVSPTGQSSSAPKAST